MAASDDDFQLQSYQDDLSTDDNTSDPLMDEYGEDLGIEITGKFDNERKYIEDFDDEDDES